MKISLEAVGPVLCIALGGMTAGHPLSISVLILYSLQHILSFTEIGGPLAGAVVTVWLFCPIHIYKKLYM